eukprot:CAMPEP_0172645836 /NCGR_PEP_ID=MMETSP1068-20121228/239937_1 /TAXON_ID=35684 /ORGANISM="Pseudopedinella elastica, Strain CCMP716" /LENGTH=277 /DNA_ID=CAMNT_0013460085 /DNA_START=126 /DNA_END=956 /DNA_ORIENTATION=-
MPKILEQQTPPTEARLADHAALSAEEEPGISELRAGRVGAQKKGPTNRASGLSTRARGSGCSPISVGHSSVTQEWVARHQRTVSELSSEGSLPPKGVNNVCYTRGSFRRTTSSWVCPPPTRARGSGCSPISVGHSSVTQEWVARHQRTVRRTDSAVWLVGLLALASAVARQGLLAGGGRSATWWGWLAPDTAAGRRRGSSQPGTVVEAFTRSAVALEAVPWEARGLDARAFLEAVDELRPALASLGILFSVASRELTSNVAKLRARLKAALSAREQA